MRLSPRELDHLQLAQAGFVAQKRLARGLRLNHPETVALISTVVLELIRDGNKRVMELEQLGATLLGLEQVLPGVEKMVPEVQIEGTFPDGTKLVTVHNPIRRDHGDLALALYASGLPVPSVDKFPADKDVRSFVAPTPIGLEQPSSSDPIVINEGRERRRLRVTNKGDRAIQVGSHYHLVETNPMLEFDRIRALGFRLNIASATAVRFEPGESKTVNIVKIAGRQIVQGGSGLCNGACISDIDLDELQTQLRDRGFLHVSEDDAEFPAAAAEVVQVGHDAYVQMYGPTEGDLVALGDTGLLARVERDLCTSSGAVYGEEIKFGGGKVFRDGMGQIASEFDASTSPDLVLTNALVIDWTGIFKADIGVKDGRIVAIGKSGNPDVMDGVDPNLVLTACTEVIAAEGKIVTAGGMDAHVHFICPQLLEQALAVGITTLYGGGTGPATGTLATTCTPGAWNLQMMMESTDVWPLNFGFSGKGNSSEPSSLNAQIEAGACGLKLHEDWGTTPKAIDVCLQVADAYDIQVSIHTDTLNESGFAEHSIAAIGGRTIHTYHTEGAGGGHAPDIIRVASEMNVLPSSTNPTRPYTTNTVDEHLDMLMVCHHLDRKLPEDIAFAESRIRAETIRAEDILHDRGALSIYSSDSQAMGRIGETILRTWQTAAKMKLQFGTLSEEAEGAATKDDNVRIKRYVSKYTINPAIVQGMAHCIGSVEVGKMADLCVWDPKFFGAKPELVLKGGAIVMAQMGDPNASIPTPEPVRSRFQYGGKNKMSIIFTSQAAKELVTSQYRITKQVEAVRDCRSITKRDLKWNDKTPNITVDPETFEVRADGELLTCEPAVSVALSQNYFLF